MVHVTGILSIFFVFPPPRRRAHGSQSRPLSGSAVVGAGANRQGSALEVKLWAVAVALNAGLLAFNGKPRERVRGKVSTPSRTQRSA